MEARRSREKLTPIFMSRQQRREFYHHRGRPPAPSPCEARAGRGAPSIELARLIGIPSPVPSPHSSVVGRGKRPAAWVEDAPVAPFAVTGNDARRTPEASAAGIRARRCYAAFARFTGSSPSSAALISRMRNFWIFPVTVVGKSVTNFT